MSLNRIVEEKGNSLRENLEQWSDIKRKAAKEPLNQKEEMILEAYDCVLAQFGLRDPDQGK